MEKIALFWGFIASAFVAFANLKKENSNYAIVVANFGMVCSYAWTLANRGSKYWQENWEEKIKEYQHEVLGKDIFFPSKQSGKGFCTYDKRYSVSRLAITLSDFTAVMWLVIVIGEIWQILDLSRIDNLTKVHQLFEINFWRCLLNVLTDVKVLALIFASIISIIYMVYMTCRCQCNDK